MDICETIISMSKLFVKEEKIMDYQMWTDERVTHLTHSKPTRVPWDFGR